MICDITIILINFYFQFDMEVNNMTVHMPHQLFIDGEFVDSSTGRTFDAINPNDGSVSTCINSFW